MIPCAFRRRSPNPVGAIPSGGINTRDSSIGECTKAAVMANSPMYLVSLARLFAAKSKSTRATASGVPTKTIVSSFVLLNVNVLRTLSCAASRTLNLCVRGERCRPPPLELSCAAAALLTVGFNGKTCWPGYQHCEGASCVPRLHKGQLDVGPS